MEFSVAWKEPGGRAVSFLGLEGKAFLVFGVANKRSVAWAVGRSLEAEGARVVYSVRSDARRKSLEALLGERPVHVCDVEEEGALERLASEIAASGTPPLQGIVHSIAFANYSGRSGSPSMRRAGRISSRAAAVSFCSRWLRCPARPRAAPGARRIGGGDRQSPSLVVTPDNYGIHGAHQGGGARVQRPLPRQVVQRLLREVRFNVVGSGPLKTSASAGIPGYLDSYLFAEKLQAARKKEP